MKLAPLRKPGRANHTPGKRRGVWYTPPLLAAKIAWWARVGGARVVDLGAGRGALSVAALEAGALVVDAIDVLPRNIRACTIAMRGRAGGRTWLGDVFSPQLDDLRADVALLNPPFEGDLPDRFIRRALHFAPRAVAIVPVNTLCGAGRAEGLWAEVVQTREARLARRPSFGGTGYGQRDIVVIELERRLGRARRPGDFDIVRTEYWPDRWNGEHV